MRGIKSLRVYDAALTFSSGVSRVLRSRPMPDSDADQLRRSSKSIGNNIAEGHGYGVGKSRLWFYRIARGSAQESLNQLRALRNEKRISLAEFHTLFSLGQTIVRMLTRLMRE
jgi:four helix bundle protein